jgi:hypothetical protein
LPGAHCNFDERLTWLDLSAHLQPQLPHVLVSLLTPPLLNFRRLSRYRTWEGSLFGFSNHRIASGRGALFSSGTGCATHTHTSSTSQSASLTLYEEVDPVWRIIQHASWTTGLREEHLRHVYLNFFSPPHLTVTLTSNSSNGVYTSSIATPYCFGINRTYEPILSCRHATSASISVARSTSHFLNSSTIQQLQCITSNRASYSASES